MIGKPKQCCKTQWAERVDIHTHKTLLSGLREASYWPKKCLRTNLIASKVPKFLGEPPDPPSCSILTHTHKKLTTPNVMATALSLLPTFGHVYLFMHPILQENFQARRCNRHPIQMHIIICAVVHLLHEVG